MHQPSRPRLTLAQSFISQGLITNPSFIRAAQVQASLLQNGSYRLLGSIMEDLEENRSLSRAALPFEPVPMELNEFSPTTPLKLPLRAWLPQTGTLRTAMTDQLGRP